MTKAVVLLSGGLDSATALAEARAAGFEPYALTILYGQRHAVEREAARRVAAALRRDPARRAGDRPPRLRRHALTDEIEVPKDRPHEAMASGIPITYVPARNTVFLALRPGLGRDARGASTSSSGSIASITRATPIAGPSSSTPSRRWPSSRPERGSKGQAGSGSTHRC